MDRDPLRFQTLIPFHRYSLILKTDSEKIVDAVSDWVDREIARHHTARQSRVRRPLVIELHSKRTPKDVRVPVHTLPTATFEDIKFYADHGHTIVTFDDASIVRVYPEKGRAKGFVAKRHLESPWTLAHRIFYVPILEMIRARGAYYVHAGCVCSGDKCILLCGASGHGKSTLTYALSRSCYSYLSDDAVFIRNDRSAGIEIFSFPEKIKLDQKSRAFFPEFREFAQSSGKMEIPASRTKITGISVSGRPYALVFTQLRHARKSELTAIPPSEALLRLVGQSISITSKESIERNLDLLKLLVESSACYELKLGRSFAGVPELVAKTLFGRERSRR